MDEKGWMKCKFQNVLRENPEGLLFLGSETEFILRLSTKTKNCWRHFKMVFKKVRGSLSSVCIRCNSWRSWGKLNVWNLTVVFSRQCSRWWCWCSKADLFFTHRAVLSLSRPWKYTRNKICLINRLFCRIGDDSFTLWGSLNKCP